ncbi:MAG: type VI secretion system protein TssL [Pseudaminobacter sp.]|nr:type VI secretion system protein TssL [Pseudaminobacter sp.]
MSGKSDPFGAGGKTVIIPTPGGAPRRDQIEPLPPVPAARARPPLPNSTVISSAFSSGPAPSGMPREEEWAHAPPMRPAGIPDEKRKPAEQPSVRIPLDIALNASDAVEFPSSNPITAAAAPLLILLGRLRLHIVDMQAVPLMTHVARSITEFEKTILEAGVAKEEALISKYVLCGTADDIVQNLPGADRHVWMQYSMLAQFFQVRTSGIGFFEELNKALANPAPRYNLLELMHACLLLGFEGQYRGAPGGDGELQRIRRDVYQTLRHVKARSDEDVSPRWRGMALRMQDLSAYVPLWAIASFAGVALVGVFFLLRFLIGNDASALADRLVALHPTAGIDISRPEFEAFVPAVAADTTQLERIRAALAEEIAAGGMEVEPSGDQIVVRVSNLVLFASGKAEVKDEFEPAGRRVAEALDKEPGPINVIGHTDSVKPKISSPFKSNHDLSVARAQSVEAVLAKTLSDPARIKVDGKGDLEAIADNKTAEGRALNRRVEIMIPKEETLQ